MVSNMKHRIDGVFRVTIFAEIQNLSFDVKFTEDSWLRRERDNERYIAWGRAVILLAQLAFPVSD